MRICPDESAKSVEGIAKYISKNFTTNSAKLRAIYSWTAQHIYYDLAALGKNFTYNDESEVINKTLRTRKTVCSGYTKTFKAIAGKLGLEVLEISGYTQQRGKVTDLSHAWCAVKIADKWKLIDPTWAAGYISSGKYHKQFTDKWFLVEPNEFLKTHIPFDPVWQFSYFPINNHEFYTGAPVDSTTVRFFDFPDTLKQIAQLTEKERLIATNRRVVSMGVRNQAIRKHLNSNEQLLQHREYNDNIKKYNLAVDLFNQAINLYNSSLKNINASANKLKEADLQLIEASNLLSEIKQADKKFAASVSKLWKSTQKLRSNIKKRL